MYVTGKYYKYKNRLEMQIMFELISKYKPSGDQPEAIKELVKEIGRAHV